jgi:hypothetical protein
MEYFFNEHGLIIICPCLERQEFAKIDHNMAFVGRIETISDLTLRPSGFVA